MTILLPNEKNYEGYFAFLYLGNFFSAPIFRLFRILELMLLSCFSSISSAIIPLKALSSSKAC